MGLLRTVLAPYPSLLKNVGIIIDSYTIFLPHKLRYLRSRLTTPNQKTLLCYPHRPTSNYILYKICYCNGYRITSKPQKADVVIYFQDNTFRKPDVVLRSLHKKYTVINYHSQDISKKRVDDIHGNVFGYGVSIDPQTYKGTYVKKSNENSLHSLYPYVTLDHPQKPQKGYVYQRLVKNEIDGEAVDIRLPIFGDTIPIASFKYRALISRFDSGNTKAKLMKTMDVISPGEYKKIVRFCREMGLDCGELDGLRDADTKKIYIVDANNTPGGPPFEFTDEESQRLLLCMSAAFEKTFITPHKNK